MKGYLVDTNIALIALSSPELISPKMRRCVETGTVYLSVVSYWEVMLKSMKGKLDVGDPRVWWAESLDKLAALPLVLQFTHIAEIHNLKPIHQDPFDRALIAQATVEDLVLLTTDGEIPHYGSNRFRVIT